MVCSFIRWCKDSAFWKNFQIFLKENAQNMLKNIKKTPFRHTIR